MTRSMQLAFDEVAKLSDPEQDAFAAILMDEIQSERRWDDRFARIESQDRLSELADKALEAARDGRTRKLNLDDL